MRSRSPLTLMEQLVMLLVFALAAALCLQAFVFADRMSARNEAVDRAVVECQRVAEQLKSGAAGEALNGQYYYDADWNEAERTADWTYLLTLSGRTPPADGLRMARVRAADREDRELFSLDVVWREVDGDG